MNRGRVTRIIDGRYRVIRLLGEGGMGKVFLVEDLLRGRKPLALKILQEGVMAREEDARLKEEFRAMTRLRHPGLARAFDFGTDSSSGRHYLTREYIEGVSLLEAARQLPAESLPDLFHQICGALEYMHSRGICHHDLKPQNILVENCPPSDAKASPRVKLLDFGLASQENSPLSLGGTVHYAPPEAFVGGPLDWRSDLYSLGVVFYEVLTGRLPFEDRKPIAVINSHLHRQPEPPRSLQPSIPRSMETIILRLLEKDPARRFSSSQELKEAIARGTNLPGRFETERVEKSYVLSGSFVGREREMEALLSALGALKESSTSRPAGILVLGPAGIGKTRLIQEFQRQVQLEEVPIYTGGFLERGLAPCDPFLEILRHLRARSAGRSPDRDDGTEAGWRRLLSILPEGPETGEASDIRPDSPSDPERNRIPDAIMGLLLGEAARTPLILHLEDLHWADDLSLEVVHRILRKGPPIPLLLTATLCVDGDPADPLEERFERIRRSPMVLPVALKPLRPDEIHNLVRSMLGTRQDVRRLAGLLGRLAGGNPLFIEELMKGLVEEGSLRLSGGRWRFDLDRIGRQVPGSVGEIISRRLERFGAEDRNLLRLLSAFGRPTTAELVRTVDDLPLAEVRERFEGLTRSGVLERTASGPDETLYGFRHRQFRDVVYRDLGKKAAGLHRRIGALLESRSRSLREDRWEELADHFTLGGDRVRGLRYSMEAARRAESFHANDRAIQHYAAALRLLGRDQKQLRGEILFRSGEIRQRIGDHRAAISDLRKARALWAELRDSGSESSALERIAWSYGSTGHLDRAGKYAREALSIAERRKDPKRLGRALNTIGMILSRSGSLSESLEYYERALSLWEQEKVPNRIASTLNNMGLVCLFQGKHEESLEYLQRSHTIRRENRDRMAAGQSLNNIGLCLRAMGRHEEAIRSFQECLSLASEVESRTDQATSLANQAETEILIGAYDSALETYERAIALLEEIQHHDHIATCLEGIGNAHHFLGDPSTAASAHGKALEKARQYQDPAQEGYALAALALDHFLLGKDEEAQRHLKEADQLARKLKSSRILVRVLDTGSRIAAGKGNVKDLLSCVDRLETIAGESGLREDRFAGLRARGEALIASGRWEEAEGVLAEAERLAGEAGRAEAHWEILAGLGRCARETRRTSLATQRYRAAAEEIRKIGSRIRSGPARERYLRGPARREVLQWGGEIESPRVSTSGKADALAALPSRALLTLYDISQAITSILSLDELLERVMDLAIDLVHAERGLIFLKDEATGEMRIRVARNPGKVTIRDASEYSTQVLKESEEGRSILAMDAGSDDRFRKFQSVSLYQIRSLMCVPLRFQDRILGTVYLDTRQGIKVFTEEDLRFLEIFAGQAAVAIENARLYSQLREENLFLKRCVEERYRYGNIIGKSPAMRRGVYDMLDRLSDTALPVLIQGESGTGKELVARAIHFQSPRKEKRFLSENCAALPESLLESELFGHVKGAFTGADRDKEGLFSLADGGTLFLDEIADMSPAMQSKLLRAVQEGEIRPVGSPSSRKMDVRILSATNRPPEKLIAEERLRQDLYYRLSVVTITIPPLRERKEDIPLLCGHFLGRIAESNQGTPIEVSKEAMDLLLRYSWPGNVRELENTLYRLALFTDKRITLRVLEQDRQTYEKLTDLIEVPSGLTTLEEMERGHILRTLEETGGDRTRAAKILGISRATIFRKLKQYRLD